MMVIFDPDANAGSESLRVLSFAMHWVCKVALSYLAAQKLCVELRELYMEGRRYFGRGAILFENVTSVCFVLTFLGAQLLQLCESALSNPVLAMSALLSWVYLLWFLLGFSSTGHLVVSIWKIVTGDLVKFTQLTSIVVVGFSLAFFILTTSPIERGPSTFVRHVFVCFHMMTNGFEKDSAVDVFFDALVVTYAVLVPILLINMLIAMMNDTYNKVSEKAEQQWRLERARVITSIEQELYSNHRGVAGKYWVEIEGKGRCLQMQQVHDSSAWAMS